MWEVKDYPHVNEWGLRHCKPPSVTTPVQLVVPLAKFQVLTEDCPWCYVGCITKMWGAVKLFDVLEGPKDVTSKMCQASEIHRVLKDRESMDQTISGDNKVVVT